jgi:hypothetical protein
MHGDFGWKCLGTAKAVCCERNFGSGVFCALASKAQQSIHRLKPSVFTRAKRDPKGSVLWIYTPLDLSTI